MIIYFTGTGNSKYLAEVLASQLNDEIIDASQYIQKNEFPTLNSNQPYVFVAPAYAWKLPQLFEEWIRKSKFLDNKKVYFILSCGSDIGAASDYAKRMCEEIALDYMGMAEVVMPENYIALFSSPTKEEAQKMIQKAKESTLNLGSYISKRIPFEDERITFLGKICSGMINTMFYKYFMKSKKFYVKNNCISCGQCVNKCMLNNIKLVHGKPIWENNCTHCMACINYCPVDAIEYGKHTIGLRRYTIEKQMKDTGKSD